MVNAKINNFTDVHPLDVRDSFKISKKTYETKQLSNILDLEPGSWALKNENTDHAKHSIVEGTVAERACRRFR